MSTFLPIMILIIAILFILMSMNSQIRNIENYMSIQFTMLHKLMQEAEDTKHNDKE